MINNVEIINLKQFVDKRGSFSEVFRKEWFPKYNHEKLQMNHSHSGKNVLRGLHYHYHQYDYWYVMQGLLRVCLLDIRKDSTTYKQVKFIDANRDIGIFIPPGVAHGFYALEESHLLYVVNNYYDANDDLGVHWQSVIGWNDYEDVNIKPYQNVKMPMVSKRDESAPKLQDIDESSLVFSY